jgi:hypothetical protein
MLKVIKIYIFFLSLLVCTSCTTEENKDLLDNSTNSSKINLLVGIIDKEEKEWLAKDLKRTVEIQLYWGKNDYLDTAFTYTYRDGLNEERYKLIFLSDEPNMNITFTANDSLNKSIMIKPGTDSSQVNYLNKGKIVYSKNINISDKKNLTFLSKEEEALFERTINSH